jgi:hypothetical protein
MDYFYAMFGLLKVYLVGKMRATNPGPTILSARFIPGFIDVTSKLRDLHRRNGEILPLSLVDTLPTPLKSCGEVTLFIEYWFQQRTYLYPLRFPNEKDIPFPPGKFSTETIYADNTSPIPSDEVRSPISAYIKSVDSTAELDVYEEVMKFMGPSGDFFYSNGLLLNVYLVAEWVGWRNNGKWVLKIEDEMGDEYVYHPLDILCIPWNRYNRFTIKPLIKDKDCLETSSSETTSKCCVHPHQPDL